jgi:exodeoxyribonuclease-5
VPASEHATPSVSDEQAQAVELTARRAQAPGVVGLVGRAGTGKTTCLRTLRDTLACHYGREVVLSAVTNRAAGVLAGKAGAGVVTVHRACVTPRLREPLPQLLTWLDDGAFYAPPPAVEAQWPAVRAWLSDGVPRDAREALHRLGIRFGDWVERWAPKPRQPGAILIVDEASMLGAQLLASAREVYDTVVLVGDRRQLPPVKDAPTLHALPSDRVATLSTVHRHARQSAVYEIAERAWQTGQLVAPAAVYRPDDAMRGGPVLVWRNATRERYTRAIRAALGLPPGRVVPGEPLVCRSTFPGDRARGLTNNSAWTVVATDGVGAELEGANGERVRVERIALEEFGAAAGTPFRFGYALTVHTAQGGEWPTVAVDAEDARARAAGFQKSEARHWAYTAATRAAQSIVLVEGVA